MTGFSNTQIDRLGERLKSGEPSEVDLRLLDAYRRSFMEPYEFVLGVARNQLNLQPTGRPAKSTIAIREKLRRESIRLSQIQDIAGCRVIVGDLIDQDRIVEALSAVFLDSDIVDRRKHPSHGYRAVHVIVRYDGKSIETQIRTTFQQLWAEFSEGLADWLDSSLKYGGGPVDARNVLNQTSRLVAEFELSERDILSRIDEWHSAAAINDARALNSRMRVSLLEYLLESIQNIIKSKGGQNAIPD